MTRFLSRSLTSEFIHLDGLQRLTNVTAHDWDTYIFKELVDNALDADEADVNVRNPHVGVTVSYIESVRESLRDRSLSIKVTNKSQFKLDRVYDVFDFGKRASVKNFYSNPTRGAQGNALKTILGIPYALRNYYFADYVPDRIPLSISTGHQHVVVRLGIDELREHVELLVTTTPLDISEEPQLGTSINVNIGRFLQQHPRTLEQLKTMARAFIMFNPHANFDFEFIFTTPTGQYQSETLNSIGELDWHGRYDHRQPTPVHWYSLSKFRQLVYALWRANEGRTDFLLRDVIREFGVATCPATQEFSDTTPLAALVGSPESLSRLYQLLRNFAVPSKPIFIGRIGETHFRASSDAAVSPTKGNPLFFYRYYASSDPLTNQPFTLEVVLFGNKDNKRNVIVGINHTPTYADPFFNKPLTPPGSDEPRRSLDKLLDYYELREDTSVTLVVHLIAPNITYENYGKSAISDEEYREVITQMVHEVVLDYQEAVRSVVIDYLSEPANQSLANTIKSLEGTQFSEMQLLFQLKRDLLALRNESISLDLQNADAVPRLQRVIRDWHKEKRIIGLIERQSGRLAVPRHDKDTINIVYSGMSLIEVVQQYQIRAIVVTNDPAIEDVFVASGYALLYDVAILRADGNLGGAIDLLINKYKNVLANSNPDDDMFLPQIWIVRDATVDAIQQTRAQIALLLDHYKLEFDQVYDLGLHPEAAHRHACVEFLTSEALRSIDPKLLRGQAEIDFYLDHGAVARIECLSPQELTIWFESQLAAHQLPLKAMPDMNRLSTLAVDRLRQEFKYVVAKRAFEHYKLIAVQSRLVEVWRESMIDWNTALFNSLQDHLKRNPRESWSSVLDQTIQGLLGDFLQDNHALIEQLMAD